MFRYINHTIAKMMQLTASGVNRGTPALSPRRILWRFGKMNLHPVKRKHGSRRAGRVVKTFVSWHHQPKGRPRHRRYLAD